MNPLLLLAAALLVAPASGPAKARLHGVLGTCPGDDRVASAAEVRAWVLPVVCALTVGLLVLSAVPGLLGTALAVPLGLGTAWCARRLLTRESAEPPDPLRLAGGWDLLAACLRCGLPVALAVRAVAEHMPVAVRDELRTVADRLTLGADPGEAWQVVESSPVHKLARAAHRSAHSGASLAVVAEAAAAEVRATAMDVVAARGQRAGVLITGPLGLCFLPAFLALGIVPVVIGLASGLVQRW